MTTQDVYNEYVRQGFADEFINWFLSRGLDLPRPKNYQEKEEDDVE